MKKRYTNERDKQTLLNTYLAKKTARNKDELMKTLTLANKTDSKNGIERKALMKLTIARIPDNIKSILISDRMQRWLVGIHESSGRELLARCFSEDRLEELSMENDSKILQVVQEKKYNKIWKMDDKEKRCIIHGRGNHSSQECRTLVRLKEKGLAIQRERNN